MIRCAIVGYGPVFNWGWMHARWMRAVADLRLVAICDRDPDCAAKAKQDFPEVGIFTDLRQMLEGAAIDLVAVVTPHSTHAAVALECLAAGKHVVVEKPMCLSVAEADTMIAAARKADRTLAVFHNRRHDGNVRAIRQIVRQGLLGDLFHLEVTACGYGRGFDPGRPDRPWRTVKEISGGALYDWGAHAVDWVLSMVPGRMTQVTGFFHKRVWHDMSNEDQTRAIVRFDDGCVAEVLQSSIAFAGKPYLWYILGTKGAIVDTGRGALEGYCRELNGPPGGSFRLRTAEGERDVPYADSDWATYYADLAGHLLGGAPVPVSAADGRRVIAVLETAEKSSRSGRSEPVPYP
ncbi:MAG: Gfo/Idh/MocA family oxidoreductase [Gemmatimonadota bacterium]